MEPHKVIVVSPHELKNLIAEAVTSALQDQVASSPAPSRNEWGGVSLAQEVLNLAESTIYANIRRIPHKKKHGRLYFNRGQLLDYLAGNTPDPSDEFEADRRRLARSRQKRQGRR